MPLFSRSRRTAAAPVAQPAPQTGLLHRHPEPTYAAPAPANRVSGSSYASTNSAAPVTGARAPRQKRSLFGRHRHRNEALVAGATAAEVEHHHHQHQHEAEVARAGPINTRASRRAGGGGLFGGRRRHADPAIDSARSHVSHAERAELEAQRKAVEARNAAQGAKREVKMLERQAAEEARLAKMKKHESKSLSRRLGGRGRHSGPLAA